LKRKIIYCNTVHFLVYSIKKRYGVLYVGICMKVVYGLTLLTTDTRVTIKPCDWKQILTFKIITIYFKTILAHKNVMPRNHVAVDRTVLLYAFKLLQRWKILSATRAANLVV
jgi:hypothetical protein